jgi:hypothetical protein
MGLAQLGCCLSALVACVSNCVFYEYPGRAGPSRFRESGAYPLAADPRAPHAAAYRR